jgi:hypothetical protein
MRTTVRKQMEKLVRQRNPRMIELRSHPDGVHQATAMQCIGVPERRLLQSVAHEPRRWCCWRDCLHQRNRIASVVVTSRSRGTQQINGHLAEAYAALAIDLRRACDRCA